MANITSGELWYSYSNFVIKYNLWLLSIITTNKLSLKVSQLNYASILSKTISMVNLDFLENPKKYAKLCLQMTHLNFRIILILWVNSEVGYARWIKIKFSKNMIKTLNKDLLQSIQVLKEFIIFTITLEKIKRQLVTKKESWWTAELIFIALPWK